MISETMTVADNNLSLQSLRSGAVFSYKLRYIVGLGLVEMAISTNPKPTIYRNLYKNKGPGSVFSKTLIFLLLYFRFCVKLQSTETT